MSIGSIVNGALATDRIDLGAGVGLANLSALTYAGWFKATTLTNQRVLAQRGASAVAQFRNLGVNLAAGDINSFVTYVTTNHSRVTNNAPLVLNTWKFIAWTFDASAGAGLHSHIYHCVENGTVAECTYSATTDGVGGVLAESGAPTMKWGNRDANDRAFQGEMGPQSIFDTVLTLADLQSLADRPRRSVASGKIAVEFGRPGMNGADYRSYAGQTGTVTGGTQGQGPAITIPVTAGFTAVSNLVTALGGDTLNPLVLDYRQNVTAPSNAVAGWDDALGPTGTRIPGTELVQATGANRPTLGAGLAFVAANSQQVISPQDDRLLASSTAPINFWVIAKMTGTSNLGGVGSNPASSATGPFMTVSGESSNWKSFLSNDGSNLQHMDFGVPFTDGAIRLMSTGKGTSTTGGAGTGDYEWRVFLAGHQFQTNQLTVATTVSGGLKAFLGGFAAQFADAVIYAAGVHLADWTATRWDALEAYAQALTSAAVLDTSKQNFGVYLGNSLTKGHKSSDPIAGFGTGTTSPGYVATHIAPTRLSQGKDVFDVHQYAQGVVAIPTATLDSQFAVRIAPMGDGNRTGNFVVTTWEITNSVFLGQTSAQILASLASITAKVRALPNGKSIVVTCIDRIDWYTTGTANALNAIAVAVNVALRANAGGIYWDYLNDIEQDPSQKFLINRSAGGFAYLDAAVYNSDGIHLTDAGYATAGALLRAGENASGFLPGSNRRVAGVQRSWAHP